MDRLDVTKHLISQSLDEAVIHAQATCLKRANRHLVYCNPLTALVPMTECSPVNCIRFSCYEFKMCFVTSMKVVTYITRQQKENSELIFKLNNCCQFVTQVYSIHNDMYNGNKVLCVYIYIKNQRDATWQYVY